MNRNNPFMLEINQSLSYNLADLDVLGTLYRK